jgi:hypothetical protein
MSPTETMCHALRTLAYDIKSHDDVPALCLRDAANMIEELVRSRDDFKAAHNETDMLLGCAKDLCRDLKARAESLEASNAELRKAADDALRHVAMLTKTANGLGACLSALGVDEGAFNDPPSMYEWCEKRGAEYAELRKALDSMEADFLQAADAAISYYPYTLPLVPTDEPTESDWFISQLEEDAQMLREARAARALEGGRP